MAKKDGLEAVTFAEIQQRAKQRAQETKARLDDWRRLLNWLSRGNIAMKVHVAQLVASGNRRGDPKQLAESEGVSKARISQLSAEVEALFNDWPLTLDDPKEDQAKLNQ